MYHHVGTSFDLSDSVRWQHFPALQLLGDVTQPSDNWLSEIMLALKRTIFRGISLKTTSATTVNCKEEANFALIKCSIEVDLGTKDLNSDKQRQNQIYNEARINSLSMFSPLFND